MMEFSPSPPPKKENFDTMARWSVRQSWRRLMTFYAWIFSVFEEFSVFLHLLNQVFQLNTSMFLEVSLERQIAVSYCQIKYLHFYFLMILDVLFLASYFYVRAS